MSRKAADTLNSQLAGKEYRDGVNDIIKNTAVRPSDLDSKALTLLDALQKHGRAKEACVHVKQALEGVTRERVVNWRGYVYTLLQRFDESVYIAMKASKNDQKKRRGDRREKEEETKTEEGRGETVGMAQPASFKEQPNAPRNNGEQLRLDVAVPKDGRFKTPQSTTFNAGAVEFVPAKEQLSMQQKALNPTSSVFVPGQPWNGGSGFPGAGAPITAVGELEEKRVSSMPLKHNAEVFVPGRPAWSGAAGSSASGATDASTAERKQQQPALVAGAAEFVPGRPWVGVGGSEVSSQGVSVAAKTQQAGGPATLQTNHTPSQLPKAAPAAAGAKTPSAVTSGSAAVESTGADSASTGAPLETATGSKSSASRGVEASLHSVAAPASGTAEGLKERAVPSAVAVPPASTTASKATASGTEDASSAAAGVGVGTVVAVVAALGGVALLFAWARRRR